MVSAVVRAKLKWQGERAPGADSLISVHDRTHREVARLRVLEVHTFEDGVLDVELEDGVTAQHDRHGLPPVVVAFDALAA